METIKIKGETVAVADLPEHLQQQCTLYDHILAELTQAKLKLGTLELARAQASAQIVSGYTEHRQNQPQHSDQGDNNAD